MKGFLRSRSSRGFGKSTGYCRDKIDGSYLVRSRMMVGFSFGFFGQIICDMFEFYIYKTGTVWRMCLKSSLDEEARIGVILRRVVRIAVVCEIIKEKDNLRVLRMFGSFLDE